MKLKLGVDVDGTLYETWSLADKYIGNTEPWTDYDFLPKKYGYELAGEAFRFACGPDNMHARVVYDQAPEVLQDFAKGGLEIVFVTHNHDPDTQYAPLHSWITDNIMGAERFKLCVLRRDENKLEFMKAAKIFGLIDDKPEIIKEVGADGRFAAAYKHGYTKELLWDPNVRVFDHWSQVPALVKFWMKQHL